MRRVRSVVSNGSGNFDKGGMSETDEFVETPRFGDRLDVRRAGEIELAVALATGMAGGTSDAFFGRLDTSNRGFEINLSTSL